MKEIKDLNKEELKDMLRAYRQIVKIFGTPTEAQFSMFMEMCKRADELQLTNADISDIFANT